MSTFWNLVTIFGILMTDIGSLVHKIDVKMVRNLIKANKLLLIKTNARVLSVNVAFVQFRDIVYLFIKNFGLVSSCI